MSELTVAQYFNVLDSVENPPDRVALTEERRPHFPAVEGAVYQVSLADSWDDVREAQRLRFQIFKSEYGAAMSMASENLDEDEFDSYCDHLIVRCVRTQEIVGTYRILLPRQARRIGRYYSQGEFFMLRIERQLHNVVELGRSCVHVDHRNGAVIMLLWSAIARYMRHYGHRYLIGCASVSMRDGGVQAATLWDQFQSTCLVEPMLEAFPKHRMQMEGIARSDRVTIPPLIRGYLRLGARVCGEPNWDPDFNTADFLMLMDLQQIDPRYARHFGLL